MRDRFYMGMAQNAGWQSSGQPAQLYALENKPWSHGTHSRLENFQIKYHVCRLSTLLLRLRMTTPELHKSCTEGSAGV